MEQENEGTGNKKLIFFISGLYLINYIYCHNYNTRIFL